MVKQSALCYVSLTQGFPGGSDGKEPTWHAGDLGSISGLGRSPGGGNGNPRQCSCLENPMDRGAWQAIVHGVTKCQTQLSMHTGRKNMGREVVSGLGRKS